LGKAHHRKFTIGLIEKNFKTPVPISKLEHIARVAFEVTGMCPGEISLVVCDDAFISELNREYRKKNRSTDVLSFSMRDVVSGDTSDPVLGDIIISIQTAEVQACEEGTTIEEEFKILFTHGLLHLLGYTHDHRDDKELMKELTNEILAGVKGYT
jgi:probable rRNA maturation factor